MKDYYEVLGVSKSSNPDELKTAYRKQALEWHPDRNKAAEAGERFKEINKAYEVLSDPKKKEMYDQFGHDAFVRGGGGRQSGNNYGQGGPFTYTYTGYGDSNPFEDLGGFSDPFEIFEQFFGFRSPYSSGRSRGKRRQMYQIEVTFEEAVKGVEKEVQIEGKNKHIKIPAGVDSNMQIRFSDFDLLIRVRPHHIFKREGQDIYLEKEISYPTAVLGGTVDVMTLDGSVKLKIRPGTQAGTTVRLRGQGIVYPNTNRKGDQYVIYRINIPERISHKSKKLLEELERDL